MSRIKALYENVVETVYSDIDQRKADRDTSIARLESLGFDRYDAAVIFDEIGSDLGS